MKLATFKKNKAGGDTTVGAFVNDCYVDLHALSGGQLPDTMIGFLEQGAAAMQTAQNALDKVMKELGSGDPAALKTAQGERYAWRMKSNCAPPCHAPERSCTPRAILIPIWRN